MTGLTGIRGLIITLVAEFANGFLVTVKANGV